MNIIMLATTKNDISYDTMSSFPLFLMIQWVLSLSQLHAASCFIPISFSKKLSNFYKYKHICIHDLIRHLPKTTRFILYIQT
jgi:hypothetical protein